MRDGLRQVVVATGLAALRGPVSGRWQLPPHPNGSRGGRTTNFADPDEREAASPADLERWLGGTEFLRLWPQLFLPRVVRAAWQPQQPTLARAGAGPGVPQM